MNQDNILHYMKLAMRTAEQARGKCSPNPFVGAVIVKHNKLIAKGFTQPYGSDHAEIVALKQAGKLAKGAEMFVTLEPCSHYGKTPPCALSIIKAGIKRVYIGIPDPNPLVSGQGIAMLQQAGLEVHLGFLEEAITQQLEYYLCYMQKQRPFVTLKTALSLDGKFAAADGSSRWISNEASRKFVHILRSQQEVILTGIKTIIEDNPMLNVRLRGKPKQPLRAVLDPLLQLPLQSKFVATASLYPSLVFCDAKQLDSPKAKLLQQTGIELCGLQTKEDLFSIAEVLTELYNRKLYSVLLESGSGVAESFLKTKLVDKCLFFYGAMILGGKQSPYGSLGINSMKEALKLSRMQIKRFGDTFLLSGYPIW